MIPQRSDCQPTEGIASCGWGGWAALRCCPRRLLLRSAFLCYVALCAVGACGRPHRRVADALGFSHDGIAAAEEAQSEESRAAGRQGCACVSMSD